MNIVVLAGGLSPERDVSISSGVMIANALRSMGHRAILADLFFGEPSLPTPVSQAFNVMGELPPRPVPTKAPDIAAVRASRANGLSSQIGAGVVELCRAADVTYMGLHGGCGENGRIQAFFDMLDIRYTGSPSDGCALAMDKHISKQLFRSAGVLTPEGVLVHKGDAIDLDAVPLPCVVKPCFGGSSLGISIVHERSALSAAIDEAFCYEDTILVEEYIRGRELTCGVLGGEALPIVEIIPNEGFYDYQHKYQPGWTEEIVPARIPAETAAMVQDATVKAFNALQLAVYGRADFLLTDDGRAYCLEVNTLPGMTPTSLLPQEAAAVGLSYPELCDRVIRLSMEKYEQ